MIPVSHGPQPHPISSSSSSSLSPLAPPFTVDHVSSSNWYHPLPSDWSSFSSSLLNSPVSNPPYPYYDRFLGRWNGSYSGENRESQHLMDPFSSHAVSTSQKGPFSGGYAAYENVSGLESLSRKVQLGPEFSDWVDDKQAGIFEENARGAYSGASTFSRREMIKGMACSEPPEPLSSRAFDLNTPYSWYIDELGSCSSDAMFYQPSTTCLSSKKSYVPPATIFCSSDFNDIPRDGYSNQNTSLFDNDAYGQFQLMEPNLQTHAYNGGNVLISESGAASHGKIHGSDLKNTFPTQKGWTSGDESSTRNLMEQVVSVHSAIKTTSLENSSSFTLNSEPDKSVPTFLETLDQLNLAIDSPCWKGQSSSQQSPFSVGRTGEIQPVIKTLEACSRNLLTGVDSNVRSSAGQVENPIDNQRLECSLLSLDDSYLVDAYDKAAVGNKTRLEDSKNDNENGKQSFDVLGVMRNELIKKQGCVGLKDQNVKVCQAKSNDAAELPFLLHNFADAEEGLKPSASDSYSGCHPCASTHIVDPPPNSTVSGGFVNPLGSSQFVGNASPLRANSQHFVKALHGLSEVLLSNHCLNDNELEEDHYELIHSTIRNLETFILKNNQGKIKANSDISGLQSALSSGETSGGDAMRLRNNLTVPCAGRKMDGTPSVSPGTKFDTAVPDSGNANFYRLDYMAKVLDKITSESSLDQQASPQTKLYKKLWIDAEIAACSMKFELQLARVNAEMKNHKHQANASQSALSELAVKPTLLPVSSIFESPHLGDAFDRPSRNVQERLDPEKSNDNAAEQCHRNSHEALLSKISMAGEVDPSVMARVDVLKRRADKPIADYVEEKYNVSIEKKDGITDHHFGDNDSVGPKALRMQLAALRYNELGGGLQAETIAEHGDGPALKSRSDIRHLDVRRDKVTTTKFHADASGGQSYASSRQGKQFTASGSSSHSSDWEHVPDDGFTMIERPTGSKCSS